MTETPNSNSSPPAGFVAAVVQEVAQKEGIHLTELPPLANAVNPEVFDLLDREVSECSVSGWKISFVYYGYNVQVDHAGEIVIK